jgi:hypothetical protein
VREGEERSGCILDGNRTSTLLDELDEPVRRIEPELHPLIVSERMFVFKAEKKAAPRAAFLYFRSAWRR